MLVPFLRLTLTVVLLICGTGSVVAASGDPVLDVLAKFELPPLDANVSLTPRPGGWFNGNSFQGGIADRGMFIRVNASGPWSLSRRALMVTVHLGCFGRQPWHATARFTF